MKVYSLLGFVDYEGQDLLEVFGSKEDMLVFMDAGFVLNSVHGTTGQARWIARTTKREAEAGITLGKILPKLAFGEYIVNVTGHAVAIVNGKIIDTFDNSAGKRVVAVFKKVEKFGE